MMPAPLHAIYGVLPTSVLDSPAEALQFSALQPGAEVLEHYPHACLDSAVMLAPPGTLERRYVAAALLQRLKVGQPFTALALKDKGGSRIAAELRALGCEVREESRSHYRICATTRPAELISVEALLGEGGMQQHPAHGLWTQPGIFSWDRIDVGTALLLAHLPVAELKGRGADLGCGLGVLSRAVLATPAIHALTLVDVDRRAVEAAARNVQDPRAAFLWADVRQLHLPEPLDFVVMNPPFHTAGIEDRALGQQFVEQAANLLKQGGVCWLVANRHLPYEQLLAQRFSHVTLVAEAQGFKIYKAET